MAENKSGNVNRKERKRIKEEVTQRLLPQMPPQLSGTPFVIDAAAKRLYVAAASEKQLETFIGYFSDTVDVEPIPLLPELAARELGEVDPNDIPPLNFSPEQPDAKTGGTLGQNFLTWLWFLQEETGGTLPKSQLGEFAFMVDGPLVFVGAFESSIRKGLPTLSAEAKAALTVGKKLKRAKLTLARGKAETWTAAVDADAFLFRGLKLPEGEQLEAHSAFEERVTYLHIFQTVFFALFDRYLKEVGDRAKFAGIQKRAKAWVKEREGK